MASAFDVYSRFVHGQQMYPLQIPQTPKQNFDSVKGNNDEQDETDFKNCGKKNYRCWKISFKLYRYLDRVGRIPTGTGRIGPWS